jgi:hypothetical protein
MEVIDTVKAGKIDDRKLLNIDISMLGRDGATGNVIVRVIARVESDFFSGGLLDFLEDEPVLTIPFDHQIANDIRQLRVFRKRPIAIYETRGEVRDNIFKSFARMDSIPLRRIDSICATIGTKPVYNCLDTIFRISRVSHGNYTTFKEMIAESFGVAMKDVDNVVQELPGVLSIGLSSLAARHSHPDVIYLIASNDGRRRLIGMAGGNQNEVDSSYMLVGNPLISDDLRRQFGYLYPDEVYHLRQQLQQDGELNESDLVKLWPNEEFNADLEKKPFFPDIEAGTMIRGMKEFADHPVVIYEIQGDLLKRILQRREEQERADVNSIEWLCQTLYDDPLQDCFNTTLGILRSAEADSGRDARVFRRWFAGRYGIDPKELDSVDVIEIRNKVIELMQRRAAYAEYFYIVTTDEAKPEPIGMVWVNKEPRDLTFDLDASESSDPTRFVTLHSVSIGPEFRKQLDDIHPEAMNMLLRQLPGAKQEDVLWEDIDLVKIWPWRDSQR